MRSLGHLGQAERLRFKALLVGIRWDPLGCKSTRQILITVSADSKEKLHQFEREMFSRSTGTFLISNWIHRQNAVGRLAFGCLAIGQLETQISSQSKRGARGARQVQPTEHQADRINTNEKGG